MADKIDRSSANIAIESFIIGDDAHEWTHDFISDDAVPCCDIEGKRIKSPCFGTIINDKDDMIVRGKNQHEAGHARLTPSNKEPGWSKLKGLVVNALEDLRIEKSIGKLADVIRTDLAGMNQDVIRSLNMKIANGNLKLKPVDEALIAMHMMENSVTPSWQLSEKAEKYFEAAYGEFVKWRDVQHPDEKAGYYEIQKVADAVIAKFEESAKEQNEQEQQNQEQNQSKSDKQDKKDQQNEQQGGQGDSSDNNTEDGENEQEDKQNKKGKGSDEENEQNENESADSDNGDDEETSGADGEDEESNGGNGSDDEDDADSEENGENGDSDDDNGESSEEDGDDTESGENGSESEENGNSEDKQSGKKSKSKSSENNEDNSNRESDDEAGTDCPEGEQKPENKQPEKSAKELLDEDFDGEDLKERELKDKLQHIFDDSQKVSRGYTAFTENDVFKKAEEDKHGYEEARKSISTVIAQLANYTEDALKAMSRVSYMRNLEHGKIDRRKLVGLSKSLTKKVFYKTTDGIDLNVGVSILIDESGSIGSMCYQLRSLAIAFSEVFQKLGIQFEVTGFTTGYGKGLPIKCRGSFTRTTPMEMFDHKSFGENYQTAKYRLGSINSYGCNIDGEALMLAFKRIQKQRVNRRIIFVLSDGMPNAGSNTRALYRHLSDTVKFCRDNKTEVYGFGIGTREPEKFYGTDNFLYLPGIDSLGPAFFRRFKEIVAK